MHSQCIDVKTFSVFAAKTCEGEISLVATKGDLHLLLVLQDVLKPRKIKDLEVEFELPESYLFYVTKFHDERENSFSKFYWTIG